MYKILIVEDDEVIAAAIEKQLSAWNCEGKRITDFQGVLKEFVEYDPQLVLLDISLPFFNGYHWCSEIRRLSRVPIVFLSSAADNMNIVMAMNMGGDDFIAKPFDMDVLVAKIQALLRRAYAFTGGGSLLSHQDITLNLGNGMLCRGDRQTELTKNELRILQKLLENKGKCISRDTLMLTLWQTDSFVDDNTLSVNINRLRKKLSALGAEDFIKTKKGIGYLID